MFLNLSERRLRNASLGSLVVLSAVLAGCGGTPDANPPKAVASAPVQVADRKLEALFTTLPPSTEPVTAATVVASVTETPPPIDPDDPEDGEPLPATPGPETPETDQKACTDNAQFYVADGTSNQEALLNRHVLCVKQLLSADVDLKDKDGVTQYHSGDMTLDSRWSVHGVHNKLEKKGTLSLRYTYTKLNDLPAPSLKVIAKISCVAQGEPKINCDQDSPVMTLSAGATSQQELTIPMLWTEPGKVARTTIAVRLIYTTDNSTPVATADGSGSTLSFEPNFNAWVLRCDRDQLRSGWKGCVFPAAPAVWKPATSTDTQYARSHISDVFATQPDVPGLFMLEPGMRSTAMTNGQYDPLTRVNLAQKKLNRAEAKLRCATTDAIELAKINKYCPPGNTCDCDEYPPASAAEGANGKSWWQYSVRRILSADNQKAGAQLGAMFAKERVLIGDEFRMSVGKVTVSPPSSTPPPTPPATPGSSDVTSSIAIVSKGWVESTVAGQETAVITLKNVGAQSMQGPFQFYFRNLPAGVTIPNAFVRDGVPYMTLNWMDFAANATNTFQVNYSGGKLSFTPYVFRGEYLD